MSTRDRRAVTIGALVLLPPLLFIWGVRPYFTTLGDSREQLAVEREALARERAALALAHKNPQLQRVADSAMRQMEPRLFAGRDDVMASAEMASYLADVAKRARVWVLDAATRPAGPTTAGVRTLHVELRAESDLRGVLRFLQSLEQGEKLVRVDRFDVSRAPRSDEEDVETLAVTATISGFAISVPPGAGAPAKPAIGAAGRGGSR
jgi:hypothetical protein